MQLRNRLVKADYWTDTELARKLPAMGRMMYQGLWQLSEDSGVIEADPVAYKMILFPLDSIDIDEIENWTNILVNLGKLIPYRCQNKDYYYIKNFHKHQSLRSPGKPELPLPEWVEYVPNPKAYQSGGYIINYKVMPGDYEGIQTVGNVNESLYKGNDSNKESVENAEETSRKPYGYRSPTNKKENKNIEFERELEKELESEEDKDRSPSVPYQDISELYNRYCPDMTKVIKMSDRRREHLRARWKEISKLILGQYDNIPEDLKEQILSVFELIFRKAGSSKFMNGKNDKNWHGDFDWIIKNNNNFTKVLEGKYDNDKFTNGSNSPPKSKTRQRIERAREKDKKRGIRQDDI